MAAIGNDKQADYSTLREFVTSYGMLGTLRMLTNVSAYGQGRPNSEHAEGRALETALKNGLKALLEPHKRVRPEETKKAFRSAAG